jgi:hypothetical protein
MIGGEKSPERLRGAVSTVSRALPNAQARMLPSNRLTEYLLPFAIPG